MQISEQFLTETKRLYGKDGEIWLAELPKIVQLCCGKWKLHNLTLLDNYSNAVIMCSSDIHNEVVLKISRNISLEVISYKQLNNTSLCRMYETDEQLGAILLERVLPGQQFRFCNSNSL